MQLVNIPILEELKAAHADARGALDAWRKEVETVRRKGFSIDRGNYINGITVIAVPVFGANNRLTHALVAAGVGDQLGSAQSQALAKDLQAEAQGLSQLLAGRR